MVELQLVISLWSCISFFFFEREIWHLLNFHMISFIINHGSSLIFLLSVALFLYAYQKPSFYLLSVSFYGQIYNGQYIYISFDFLSAITLCLPKKLHFTFSGFPFMGKFTMANKYVLWFPSTPLISAISVWLPKTFIFTFSVSFYGIKFIKHQHTVI